MRDPGGGAPPPQTPDRPSAGGRALVLIPPGKRDRLGGGLAPDSLLARLRKAGFRPDMPDLDSPDAFPDAIRAAAGSDDPPALVLVGGGDGTLSAVADAMADTGLTLGILPLGTANDLARTLGLPFDPAAALEVALTGRRRSIDIGTIDGRGFFNVASIGLSVDVADALDSREKRRLGIGAYIPALFRVMTRHRRFRVRLTVDGRNVEMRAVMVAIGNGRHHGGGLTVSAGATIDDGMLDVYVIEPVSHWRMALMLPALRLGTAGPWMGVHRLSGRTVRVETPAKPKRVNVDGEILTRTPAEFGVRAGAVSVVTPDRPAADLPGTSPVRSLAGDRSIAGDTRSRDAPAGNLPMLSDKEAAMSAEDERLAAEIEIALQDMARAAREGEALTRRMAESPYAGFSDTVIAALGQIGADWARIAVVADDALDAMDLPTRDADDDRALIEDVVDWLEGLVGMPVETRASQRLHHAAARIEVAIDEVRRAGDPASADAATIAYDDAWRLIDTALPAPVEGAED